MDRLTAMQSFVKVVENGGFSAAARRLGISASMVTAHIKLLEDRLGVLLLNRSTRNVSLTGIGQAYYERCVQILAEIDDADQIAEQSQIKPRGILRLNVAQAIPAVIAPTVAEFGALYPEASIRLTVTSQMVDLIEEGYDLAIRLTAVHDSSLILRRLANYRLVVCGAPSYFERRGRPKHPSELEHHNCLFFYDSLWGKHWHFAAPDGEKTLRLSGNLETNSVVSIRTAAILGQGLICAPSFMVAADLKSGQLLSILSEFFPTEFSIDALYPHRRYLSAKVRSFLDLAAKHFHEAHWHGTDVPLDTAATV